MSKLGRVQSKNLFSNLRLEGVYDEEVAADIPVTDMGMMDDGVKQLMAVKDDGTAVATFVRKMMDAVFPALNKNPYFLEKIDACLQEKINVPPTDENDFQFTFIVQSDCKVKRMLPSSMSMEEGL